MVNAIYDKGRQSFLEGTTAWLTDTIRVVLVDTDLYTVNLATHANLSDIPVAARVATSPVLASKTSTDGVADAADFSFTAVSGAQSEALVIYKDTGTATSSTLLVFIDSAAGLAITPNGADIAVTWPSGPQRIFKL